MHRKHTGTERWAQVTVEELLAALPEEIDILLNPDGPAPLRLYAQALRDSVAKADPA